MKIIQPPSLKAGDTVAIAASARKISADELNFAVQCIKKREYKLVFASNIGLEYYQFAGTDEERAMGLQKLLDTPEIKAIFIARGGYGTVRIIDKLNFDRFKESPKWICGFSDVTVLHNHLFNLGFQSIHSAMPLLFEQSEKSVEFLFNLLEGKQISYDIPLHPLNRRGRAEGFLIGGNLSVLYSLNNSISQPDYRGKILFIEDIDEYLYHIDRMMMQMKRAGFLKQLKGLLVGGFTDMKDNTVPFGKTAEEIIHEAVKEYDYPVCFNFPSGHIKDNLPFVHGRKIKLSVSEKEVSVETF